jgi:uncharacterized membrane protein YoaK (UPF0700 family)
MNKLQKRIQLLTLISIFFIYRAVTAYLENDINLAIVWFIMTIVYIISLIIMLFVAKNWQERVNI